MLRSIYFRGDHGLFFFSFLFEMVVSVVVGTITTKVVAWSDQTTAGWVTRV